MPKPKYKPGQIGQWTGCTLMLSSILISTFNEASMYEINLAIVGAATYVGSCIKEQSYRLKMDRKEAPDILRPNKLENELEG